MSVVIETTLGDVTVDLFINDRPRACLNFLKLCKIKYYNFNLFHTISRGFIAQTGDPTGSRSGGESIYGILDGQIKRFFEGENEPRIKHTKMGLISFVGNEERMVGSQFFFTLGEDLTYLDEKHCVFGEIVEGFDILEIINEVICDNEDRPYQDVRITHTVILDDPFPDPKRLILPSRSPSPSVERLKGGRIAPDEEIDELEGKSQEEVMEMQAEREAKARATILEMVGDLPDAEMAPPENVLFVCKLNPVTNDDDLEIIFSRFGKIKSCEVIRDKKTGDSLQYAFVEFEDKTSCENAYFKMDNVLIDDRRIHVDFSQSVSKVKWRGKGRGVLHFDGNGRKSKQIDSDIGKGNYKHKERSNRIREKSRSPNVNRGYKNTSNYERSLTAKRNDREYSKKIREYDRSSNGKQNNSYTSDKSRSRTKGDNINSLDKDRYTSKSNREESYASRNRTYSPSPSRKNRNYDENRSSERYKMRYTSPNRKISRSPPISKRDQDNGSSKRSRSRSLTPRKNSRNYEKSHKNNKNVSTSSYDMSVKGKKSQNRRRSPSSEDEDESESDDGKYDTKRSSKTHDKRKNRVSPERKKYNSKTTTKTSEKEKTKDHIKRKKKASKYSSSDDSDSDRDLRKKKSHTNKSSDDERRSKKRKSEKKSKRSHTSSSDSDDDKRKKKRKKKYHSDSDSD